MNTRQIKIGSLVRRANHFSDISPQQDLVGLVVDYEPATFAGHTRNVQPPTPQDHWKVIWLGDYGTLWAPEFKLEKITSSGEK
jgi:hypothetical protein|tara:strand:+ start:356 stop:604 length:249 start_codon:yes stop_codon:yes gene_type:complete